MVNLRIMHATVVRRRMTHLNKRFRIAAFDESIHKMAITTTQGLKTIQDIFGLCFDWRIMVNNERLLF